MTAEVTLGEVVGEADGFVAFPLAPPAALILVDQVLAELDVRRRPGRGPVPPTFSAIVAVRRPGGMAWTIVDEPGRAGSTLDPVVALGEVVGTACRGVPVEVDDLTSDRLAWLALLTDDHTPIDELRSRLPDHPTERAAEGAVARLVDARVSVTDPEAPSGAVPLVAVPVSTASEDAPPAEAGPSAVSSVVDVPAEPPIARPSPRGGSLFRGAVLVLGALAAVAGAWAVLQSGTTDDTAAPDLEPTSTERPEGDTGVASASFVGSARRSLMVELPGSGVVQVDAVTGAKTFSIGGAAEPAVSGDGSVIAVSHFVAGESRISAGPLAPSGPGELAPVAVDGPARAPAVNQDGSKVAFVEGAEGSGDIFVFDRPSGGLEQLAGAPEDETSPAYDLGSERLAFVRRGPVDVVVVVGADGGELASYSGPPTRKTSLAWSPDGTTLAIIGGEGDAIDPYLLPLQEADPTAQRLPTDGVDTGVTFIDVRVLVVAAEGLPLRRISASGRATELGGTDGAVGPASYP